MSLLTLSDISLNYGPQILLDKINLEIEPGEHIALIGRNGEGKSSLLKVLADEIAADSGEVIKAKTVNINLLAQEGPAVESSTVFHSVALGLGELGMWLEQYQQLSQQTPLIDQQLMGQLHQKIDLHDGWNVSHKVETILSKMQLDPQANLTELSGGMQRRVLLAQALVAEPDVLLLDEPTNHLDLESILWLEKFLVDYRGCFIVVTHDRTFMQQVARRIIALDRGQIYSYPGDYNNYLRRLSERLHAEEKHHAEFDKKLAIEERWIRQGVKARRTRNEGRVRALEKMRKQRGERRNLQGKVKLDPLETQQSGKQVIEAEHVYFAYEGKQIINDFSCLMMRGDKVGIVGPNGCGKTTLLKILLGSLTPDQGSINRGTHLDIAYFDQLRCQLDERLTALENVAGGRQEITINGKSKHAISYLQDFLFTPDRAHCPITRLSGGERNRLMLAKLFSNPTNVLVMDEPTNDLDIESLELLESLLVDYVGTLLLVSHDRSFLNNVATSLYVSEGFGKFIESVGGYDDYLQAVPKAVKKTPKVHPKKLDNTEKRELQKLPAKIEKIESVIQQLHDKMADNNFYTQTESEIKKVTEQLQTLENELKALYKRWEYLEENHPGSC